MNINGNRRNSSLHIRLRPLENGYLPLAKGLSDNKGISFLLIMDGTRKFRIQFLHPVKRLSDSEPQP
jgi:hypothetical protein